MSKYPGRIVTDLAPAGYSVFFDGTGDYLSVADNTALDMGSSDFTIEFWTYLVGTPSTYQAYFAKRANTGTYGGVELYLTSGRTLNLQATLNGSSWGVDITTTSTVPFNTWTHIAAVRNGNTWVVYVNGTAGATSGTVSGTVPDNANTFVIGAGASDGSHVMVSSYISNFRVVKGTALYTAAFTPPTQLFNITNTSLLTCNSPALVDQSTNNFTITANGNAAVSTLTPFPAYVPYNPALGASTPGVWTVDEAMQAAATRQWNMYDPYFNLTTLLLHGNGTNGAQNNTFLDSSTNNFTITRNGNTTQGSYSPFSQTGWSVNHGVNNYWQAPASTNWDITGAAFTVEMWVYLTSFTNDSNQGVFFVGNYTGSGGASGWSMGATFGASPVLQMSYWNGAGGTSINSTGVIPLNAWTHVALTRSGSTLFFYINGISVGTAAAPSIAAGDKLTSGAYVQNFSYPSWVYGSISNLRIIKGTALYSGTGSFTPPTGPLTAVANTVFLGNQSNRFIDNGPNAVTITPSGTLATQPFSPFLPTVAYTPQTIGGSGYFDGSGDNIQTAGANANLSIGTGDFTFECWAYLLSASSDPGIMQLAGSAFGTNAPTYTNSVGILVATGSGLWLMINNGGFTAGSISARVNAWTHLAVCRSGTTHRLFVNGVQAASVTDSSNYTTQYFAAGCAYGTNFPSNAYISNVRLLRGTALYTSAFTPPTAPLTAITNTSLLLNFTNAGVVDSTADNVLETVGNAQISTTQSKFGGSSIYMDGTGDYLQVAPNQLFDLRTSNFTLEFWVYPTSFAVATYPIYSQFNRSTTNAFAIEIRTTGRVDAYVTNAGGAAWSLISAGELGTVTLNTWNHVAFVRNGTAFRGYVNGVQGALSTNSSNTIETFNGFNIGATGAGTSGYFTGYFDEYRISRYARYTGAFTPQTSQWQDQ